MNKKIITVLILLVVVAMSYFLYKNYNLKLKSNVSLINYNQPKCSFTTSTIGIYKYAFTRNQDSMIIYNYATNGIKGGEGFDFGQKVSNDKTSIDSYYQNFLKGQSDFNNKYPNESRGSSVCTIAGISGYCGFYKQKLGLFTWTDAHSYNIISNFYFDKAGLEPIVKYFNSCNS